VFMNHLVFSNRFGVRSERWHLCFRVEAINMNSFVIKGVPESVN
jgi:hypothetical protein